MEVTDLTGHVLNPDETYRSESRPARTVSNKRQTALKQETSGLRANLTVDTAAQPQGTWGRKGWLHVVDYHATGYEAPGTEATLAGLTDKTDLQDHPPHYNNKETHKQEGTNTQLNNCTIQLLGRQSCH